MRGNGKSAEKQYSDRGKSAARKRLGLPDCLTILSAGGSQGASRLNEAVVQLLAYEQKRVT